MRVGHGMKKKKKKYEPLGVLLKDCGKRICFSRLVSCGTIATKPVKLPQIINDEMPTMK